MSEKDVRNMARCEGKHRFESMMDARNVAKRARRSKDGSAGMHAYRCPNCKGAHVGSLVIGKRHRRPHSVIDDEGYE